MRLPWYQLVWGHPVVHLPDDAVRPLLIPVTDQHPHGFKGAALLQIWVNERETSPGFVVVDGDTALDPADMVKMEQAVASDPECIWTAACRIWGQPVLEQRTVRLTREMLIGLSEESWHLFDNPDWTRLGDEIHFHGRPQGVYAHRVYEGGRSRWGRLDDDRVDLWGFGCTYLPNALLERVDRAGRWGEIEFPYDDLKLSHIAMWIPRIEARLVPWLEVKHMHFWRANVDREAGTDADHREHLEARCVSAGETR